VLIELLPVYGSRPVNTVSDSIHQARNATTTIAVC